MPSQSTWKKQASLLLSRLGSKRAAASAAGSSLVVQAGFPTSLADLYVKNRTKILPKKPDKHRPVNPNPTPTPNPNPIPPPTVAVRPPHRTAENSNTGRPNGLGLGLGFLAVVLAVGKKWIVAVITILSLALMVVEFFGLPEKNKKLGLRKQSPDSDSATASDVFLERSEILAERRDFDENRTSSDSAVSERSDFYKNPTNNKKEKLLRRLFRRKCSRKKNESVLENKERVLDEDGDDVEFLSCEDDDGLAEVDSDEVAAVVANADGNRLRIRRKLGFLVVILFGLLGGKAAAVALSMVWVLVFGCTGTVRRKWKLK